MKQKKLLKNKIQTKEIDNNNNNSDSDNSDRTHELRCL